MKSRFRKSVERCPELASTHPVDGNDFDDYMTIPLPIDKQPTRKSEPTALKPLLGKTKINELMTETREEAMNIPISSDSKGFKLLQKFGGYTGKGGLGKSNQGSSAPLRVERYDIDRSGVGIHDIPRGRVNKKRKASEQDEKFQTMSSDYRSQISESLSHKKLLSDLRKAELVIYDLDTKLSIPVHELWPHSLQPLLVTNDELDQDVDSRLNSLNEPVSDGSEENIQENASISDEGDENESDSAGVVGEIEYEDVDDIYLSASSLKPTQFPTSTKAGDSTDTSPKLKNIQNRLNHCLEYLRSVHHYCLYCGCQYSNDEEIKSLCPGVTSDDH